MLLLDTHFLINWVNDPEGDDLFDVVSSKMVVPPDDVDDILGVKCVKSHIMVVTTKLEYWK